MEPIVYDLQMTAREYLEADSTSPLGSVMFGMSHEEWMDEYFAVENGLDLWLEAASEATLRGLLAAYETMTIHDTSTVNLRLIKAQDSRDIPSLPELRALAERIGEAELLDYCDRAENPSVRPAGSSPAE